MAVTVTAEKLETADHKYDYDGYTVYVGNHRILTVSTDCSLTISKWLKEVQKQRSNNSNKRGALVVGVAAAHEHVVYEKGGAKDAPYDLLQLCVGSHCLLYSLKHSRWHDGTDLSIPRAFQAFFSDPRVTAVGMNMSALSKRLERHHQLKIANPVDLNRMAVAKLSSADILDLGVYDLDRLAMAVVGRHMYFDRPEYDEEMTMRFWPCWSCRHELLPLKQVKYATLDTYLCFLVGSKLLDDDDDDDDDDDKNKIGGSVEKKKIKKMKKKKKKNMKAMMGGAK